MSQDEAIPSARAISATPRGARQEGWRGVGYGLRMNASSLQSGDIAKIALGVIAALVVVGGLLSLVVTKIVGRIVILVVVVVLGGAVWNQHKTIEDKVKNCDLNMTFFGVDVKAPANVKAQCLQIKAGAAAKSAKS
jgi:hypothetical protein